MYGVLRSAGCGLPAGERQAWWGHLCGLCLNLRQRFGQAAGLATNSDSALLIALCEAQSETPISTRKHVCLLRRPFSGLADDPSQPAVAYASGAAMLIAADKVRDNLQDDPGWLRGVRRPARALAENWRSLAGEYLAALGFQAALVEGQFRRQVEVEAQPGGVFADYSQPTELAVGAAFAHTAVLAGRPRNSEALFAVGRGYGRIMLLLDAYRDYDADVQAAQFNPLRAAFPAQDWRPPARALFQGAYSQLREAAAALELPNPSLLNSLLLRQLGQVGRRSLGLCRTAAPGHPAGRQTAALALSNSAPLRLQDDSQDDDSDTQGTRSCCNTRDCCYGCFHPNCHCPPCGEGNGCDCNSCDCRDYDWSTCGCCPCSDCNCSDCSHCDCSSCDCGGCCDCGNCDCGGCDCN
mgnify:FL=1